MAREALMGTKEQGAADFDNAKCRNARDSEG
jgi:hypothetical protein